MTPGLKPFTIICEWDSILNMRGTLYTVRTVDTNLQQTYMSWITRMNEEAFKVGFKHPLQNTIIMQKFISSTSFRGVPTLLNQTLLGHFEKKLLARTIYILMFMHYSASSCIKNGITVSLTDTSDVSN